MVDHVEGQAGGLQALAGFVPVEADQLVEVLRLLRIIEEGPLMQLQLAGLAVQ
ncbi:hypothetical protein D3C72_2164910 [compost metagenome]